MDDINIIQTSLNVNTSIDYVNDSNNHKNKNRWKNYNGKKHENSKTKQKDILAVSFQTTQEYSCTSLQMNTSLDISNKLQNDNNTIDAFPIKDINSMNTRNDNFDNDNIIDDNYKTNNYEIQHQNTVIQKKMCDSEHNDIVNNIIDLYSNSEMCTIIKESSDKCNVGMDQNTKHSIKFPKEKKSKRKLLPLHECSQLVSISPVQDEKCISPAYLIFKKSHKRKNNKPNNINNIESINKNNNRDHNRKTQKKKIISKKIIVKKIINDDILRRLEENKENYKREETRNVYTEERNSSDDFQLLKNSSIVHVMKKKTRENRLNIVATGLSNEDKDRVKSIVKILGLAKIESNVTKNTTHVVTTGIHTINLLHGIIRGCWLVTLEWVLKSLENNTWLNPEKYEIVHFSKAVLENRKDRQLFGKSYVPELFTACGYIYVQKNTTPPYNILQDLIKAAGGCVTEHPETARILIGTGGLKETWIFDCITSGELQPHDQYKR
ncbi:putative uncharacterized protein DDB_G0277255 isoform X2 [Frieseomelitta varia]|nr:putative uncharacterized protein DDB_G0277255 isoform X2 [Frieseomelitta varia]